MKVRQQIESSERAGIVAALEERWLPILLGVWRRRRGTKGPEAALSPAEVREVGAAVRELSLGLTRDRALVGTRYMDDPALLGAYLLFFWPISYAQGRSLLAEVDAPAGAVLDLGAGPGPLALAALDAGHARAVAADRSAQALALAAELARAAGHELSTTTWDGQSTPPPEGRFGLVTMGHALNELWVQAPDVTQRRVHLVEAMLGRLTPGGRALLVEPALRETSRGLLEVRDALVERGVGVRAPCIRQGPCPALDRATDWCHEDRAWEAPAWVEALADEAGLRKTSLKMSYLVLSPAGEAVPAERPGWFRIVSEPLYTKGRLRYIGCGAEGRVGLSMPARHLGEANGAFADLPRGTVVAVEGVRAKGDGLALDGASRVEVIAPVGRRPA